MAEDGTVAIIITFKQNFDLIGTKVSFPYILSSSITTLLTMLLSYWHKPILGATQIIPLGGGI